MPVYFTDGFPIVEDLSEFFTSAWVKVPFQREQMWHLWEPFGNVCCYYLLSKYFKVIVLVCAGLIVIVVF